MGVDPTFASTAPLQKPACCTSKRSGRRLHVVDVDRAAPPDFSRTGEVRYETVVRRASMCVRILPHMVASSEELAARRAGPRMSLKASILLQGRYVQGGLQLDECCMFSFFGLLT